MANSLIKLKNVSKVYGKKSTIFQALRDVSLSIEKGESLAIIGKSGSGKSTLMHILALLDSPSKGRVYIDGVDSTRLKNRRLNKIRNRKFGFVFQQFFMNPRDTVLNNVMLPLQIAGVRKSERRKRAMQALKIVDLTDKAKNKANDLSGGQKQRVCIARAIVNNPSVIFADEPTGNLDSVTGKKIEDLLLKLNKKAGITLILVTHDEDMALKCDRQIYIKDGKVEL
jgi:putative ABC transport system ATP-binding protein